MWISDTDSFLEKLSLRWGLCRFAGCSESSILGPCGHFNETPHEGLRPAVELQVWRWASAAPPKPLSRLTPANILRLADFFSGEFVSITLTLGRLERACGCVLLAHHKVIRCKIKRENPYHMSGKIDKQLLGRIRKTLGIELAKTGPCLFRVNIIERNTSFHVMLCRENNQPQSAVMKESTSD